MVQSPMSNTKPLVAQACVCEQMLQDKDGVSSLIRVVDTFYLADPPAGVPDNIKAAIQCTAVVSLKSGALKGKSVASLRIRSPSGKLRTIVEKWPLEFLEAEEYGANISVRMTLEAKELGLYVIDVLWEGETLTSIPIRLKKAPETDPQTKTET